MNDKVKNLYDEAVSNTEFQDQLKIHEPKDYKPTIFWPDNKKALYATVYMGWLIARNEYDEKKY